MYEVLVYLFENCQQAEIADGIRISGTARAAFLPRGIEHEVIDQELPAALE